MVTREDIALGVYLRQTTGERLGVIAVVHQVGTSWSGEWFFQLRYLSRPVGVSKRASSEWSSNLRQKDLAHFELIGEWITAQAEAKETATGTSLDERNRTTESASFI